MFFEEIQGYTIFLVATNDFRCLCNENVVKVILFFTRKRYDLHCMYMGYCFGSKSNNNIRLKEILLSMFFLKINIKVIEPDYVSSKN